MTIYELTDELRMLQAMLEEADEDDQALADTLEMVQMDFEAKVDGYCAVIRNMQLEAAAIKEEERRLAERRKRLETRSDRLQETLHQAMVATKQKKLAGELFTLSVRATSKVVIDNVDDIPFELLTFKDPEPNKTKIKEYLKENEAPWAHIEQGTSLSIK